MSAPNLFIIFDDGLLGSDFVDDIDIVSTNNSAKRVNRISKMNKEPKREIICVDITTHEMLPDLLKTIDPNNNDDGANDDASEDGDDGSSEGSSNDDNVRLPESVYLVTPYEDDEKDDLDIDYEREIEVFVDEIDAKIYIETRKRDPRFRNVNMVCVKKKVFRDSEIKKEYAKAKAKYELKEAEVKKKQHSGSSASSSSASQSGSASKRNAKGK
jgi:hypothetical protein